MSRTCDVFHRQYRKSQTIGLACGRIDGYGRRRAEWASERVDADHEEVARVDRPARPDHVFPPARRGILGGRRSVCRRRQAGENQDRIVSAELQIAPGLIGNLHVRQRPTTPHLKRPIELQYFSRCRHGMTLEMIDRKERRTEIAARQKTSYRASSLAAVYPDPYDDAP